jgi:hypothetical protein
VFDAVGRHLSVWRAAEELSLDFFVEEIGIPFVITKMPDYHPDQPGALPCGRSLQVSRQGLSGNHLLFPSISPFDPFETCRPVLKLSAFRGRLEVTCAWSE